MTEIHPEYPSFLKALERLTAERAPGTPMIVLALQQVGDDAEYMVRAASFCMKPPAAMACIGYMIESLAETCPYVVEAQRLRVAWRRIAGGGASFMKGGLQ